MATKRQPHLKLAEPAKPRYVLVEAATGERLAELEEHPGAVMQERDALKVEKAGWITRYNNLKRDKEADARDDARWPRAKAIFDYWRERCKHPRSQFDADRFHLIAPFLDKHGDDLCRQAIDGAAFDPFTKKLKNGAVQRYDSIELIFRNADKFESFCNRAPRRSE